MRLLPARLVGQTIRGIRNRLGLSAVEFAKSVGVEGGGAQVSRWEKGMETPDYGTLARIAAMGLVDVFVFAETTVGDAADAPQVTPGEAAELRRILDQMEELLGGARRIVERASSRTVAEALEAAAAQPPRLSAGEDTAVALAAEVRVEARPRRSSRAASSSGGAAESGGGETSGRSGGGGRSRSGGGSARGGGSGARSSSRTGGGTGAKSGGGKSSSGGRSRSRSGGGGGSDGGGESQSSSE